VATAKQRSSAAGLVRARAERLEAETEAPQTKRPTSPRRIAFTESANRALIRLITETWDGTESGGALLGFLADNGVVVIADACGPSDAAERTPTSIKHDLDRFLAFPPWHLRGYGEVVGDWHTHPCGGVAPSDGDMRGWAGWIRKAVGYHVGLIVTRGSVWLGDEPRLHAWIATRENGQPSYIRAPFVA
jgi:integrative and conjugative element protein (TIGR02256 family)